MEEIKKELESGRIIISEDVICTIASIATNEVEGVYGMAGNIATGIVEMIGKKSTGKGVKVDIDENNVNVEVHFVANYGVKITEVCNEIQEKVKKAIEAMCGMEVLSVNVFVESIYIEKEPKKESKKSKKEESEQDAE